MKLLSFFVCVVTAVSVFAADPEKIAELKAGKIDTAYASWWGFDEEDSTRFLQDAVSSGAKKVIVDYTGKDWIIGKTIHLVSNQELFFADKVVVRAKKGEFKRIGDMLFKGTGISNTVIRGEGDTKLVMNKADYLDKTKYQLAEWRHIISLHGASNITIRDITLLSSGGDGIYLGAGSPQPYCKDIHIENVTATDGNRLGIAVITAENLLIRNCRFINTKGASPAGGIDLEPNRAVERLVNIRIEDCEFLNSHGAGISVSPNHLNENSVPVSVTFKNCKSSNNGLGLFLYPSRRSELAPVKGTVEFIDCDFSGSTNLFQDTIAGTIKFIFSNCAFSSDSQNTSPFLMLCKEASGRKIGGIYFKNCTVKLPNDKIEPVILNYLGSGAVSEEIKGSLKVQAGSKIYMFDFPAFIKERQQYFDMVNKLKTTRNFDLSRLNLPKIASPRDPGNNQLYTRGKMKYIQYASKGDKITIETRAQSSGYPGGIDLILSTPDGKEIQKKQIMPDDKTVLFSFEAEQTGYYFLTGGATPRLDIFSSHPGGAYLIDKDFQVLLPIRGNIYFEVPAGVKEFNVGLSGDGFDASLATPSGEIVQSEKDIRSMTIFSASRTDSSKSEIWSIRIDNARWHVNLRLFDPLPPLFSTNPYTMPLLGDPLKAIMPPMPKPSTVESSALLRNGGFEQVRNDMPMFWQHSGGTDNQISIGTENPAEGKSFLKTTTGKSALVMMNSSNIPVKSGDKLTFSLKVRGQGKFTFNTSHYDKDRKWIRPNGASQTFTIDTVEWREIKYEYTIPNSEREAVSFRLLITISADGKLDFDGITVNK